VWGLKDIKRSGVNLLYNISFLGRVAQPRAPPDASCKLALSITPSSCVLAASIVYVCNLHGHESCICMSSAVYMSCVCCVPVACRRVRGQPEYIHPKP
jgi:hypothetical protein